MIKTHSDETAELEAALVDIAGQAVARLRASEFALQSLRDRLLLRIADLQGALQIGAVRLERLAGSEPANLVPELRRLADFLREVAEKDPREEARARAAVEARQEARE